MDNMDILVIGSLNMDLVIHTPRMPLQGETILGGGFRTIPGGKGANQAVAASRLGGKVRMAGCVGSDSFGDTLLANLISDQVDTARIRSLPGIPTGTAVIVLENGNNRIIVDPGANGELSPEQVDTLEPVMRHCGILLIQLEIPLPAVQRAIALARRHGLRIILNPAPAALLPDILLRQVDILTPNESECASLTGLPTTASLPDGMPDVPGSLKLVEKAILALLDRGIPQVVVTLGEHGVMYNRNTEIVHKPAAKVRVVDTTAAGDSFSGALAVAFAEGMDIDSAIDFANMVGSLTVMKAGAQTSLPTRAEVLAYTGKVR